MSGLQVSFEFFPPKTPEMEENLWRAIKRLEPLAPRFVSVTYGAGGGTRERTHRTVKRILAETPLVPAAHLTCVAATSPEVDQVARDYWNAGVRHIVALRGDPPGGGAYEPPAGGYQYAADLVTGLKAVGDFEITVACFPEGHPESTSPHLDLDHLKRKIDAGATRAITQFFFDNDHYFRFLDKVRRRGISCEIVPGIMPVMNFRTMVGFAAKAGASVPRWLGQRFEGLDDDVETRRLVAATTVAEQVQGLVEQGVREFHFYTLNRADLSFAICHILGIRPKKPAAVEASP
ncbi:MAG: methylenetetrahydrofolate reductase [NAD(P)H] [Gemmatimonadales bacterium]